MAEGSLRQILALSWDTVLQARRRWVIVSLLVLATLVLLFYAFLVSVERGVADSDVLKVSFPFEGVSLEMEPSLFAHRMLAIVLGTNTVLGLFFLMLAFSGFIPESIQKGTADLLLSKPVPRWLILSVKMATISLIASVIASYYFFGALVIIWAKSGYFAADTIPLFLLSLLMLQPLVPLMAFVGVFSRSTPLTMISCVGVYVLSALAEGAHKVGFEFSIPAFGAIAKGLFHAFPRFLGMQQEILESIGRRRGWSSHTLTADPFYHCAIICVIYVALALVVFQRKDYTS